jgi:hypothetical protein
MSDTKLRPLGPSLDGLRRRTRWWCARDRRRIRFYLRLRWRRISALLPG